MSPVYRALAKYVLALAALLLVQYFWLLSTLDTRVQSIIDGVTPDPSSLHVVYVVIESLKLALLVSIGIRGFMHAPQHVIGAQRNS